MNIDQLKKETAGPVYPAANLVILYENEVYGYEIGTVHPTFGPVQADSTWSFANTEKELIEDAKGRLRERISRLSAEAAYPKTIKVDLSESYEPVKVPWYRRMFAARS